MYSVCIQIKKYINNVFIGKKHYLFICLCAILTYGFSVFNRTLSIDDLAQSYYYGDSMAKLSSTRWGQVLVNRLFSTIEFMPFINKIFGVFFLVITSIIIGGILYEIDKNKTYTLKYLLFSLLFISYPLINEFFSYYEALTIPFDMTLVAFAIYYQLVVNKFDLKNTIIEGLILAPVMSGYESVVFMYITLVLIVIYIKNLNNDNYRWLFEGIRYATPLIIAFVFRYIIGYSLICIYSIDFSVTGATNIYWFKNFDDALLNVAYNAWYYGVRALSYLPITEFLIAAIIFIYIVIKDTAKHNCKCLIIGILLFISLFLLSIIQGTYLPYRTAQSIQLFVAFVSYLFLDNMNNDYSSARTIINIATTLMFFVSLRQSIYLCELLALDNQRSDNEAKIVETLGYKIYSEFDNSKQVIICGEYQLGSFIENQISINENGLAYRIENYLREITGHNEKPVYVEYVNTNINSTLNWSKHAFDGSIMKKYFSYYGYEINIRDIDWEDEKAYLSNYEKIAKNEGMNPLSIKDMGDYILVYLGPSLDNAVN